MDAENTVKSLRDELQALINVGHHDSGFPILRHDQEGARMVGYIGANELEHALSIVADEADQEVTFHPTFGHSMMVSSVSSLVENGANAVDPFDFSVYMDRVRFPFLLTRSGSSFADVSGSCRHR